MKKIMILGAGILQLPAILQAKSMGLSVVAVDINPKAIGFNVDGIECEIISTVDMQGVLKAAKRLHIDGIMTLASDMPMRTIAKVSKEMGLIGITGETALKATNKIEMREALAQNGVPIPAFCKAKNEEEFLDAVRSICAQKLRVIVKPADNSGSRGVSLLEDYSENVLKKTYAYSRHYSRSGDVVVEEYMEGLEVSVETLTIDGICHIIQITDKLTTGPPFFVEMGHSEPSQLEEAVQKEIKEIVAGANKAIGINHGPSHTEIIITKEGPKIVELGARLGGDNITTHLVPLSTGVNMVECCIKIALGEKPDIGQKFRKAAAIRYIETDEGRIESIKGIEDARKTDGIKQISILRGVGDVALKIKSSVDRVGFVIAQADSITKAIEACNCALKIINIECKKG